MVYFRGIGSKKIITIRLQTPPIACESKRGPALQGQEFDSIESDEVRVSLLIDDEWGIIPPFANKRGAHRRAAIGTRRAP